MTEALTNTLQAIHKAGCVTLADIVEGSVFTSKMLFLEAIAILYSYIYPVIALHILLLRMAAVI